MHVDKQARSLSDDHWMSAFFFCGVGCTLRHSLGSGITTGISPSRPRMHGTGASASSRRHCCSARVHARHADVAWRGHEMDEYEVFSVFVLIVQFQKSQRCGTRPMYLSCGRQVPSPKLLFSWQSVSLCNRIATRLSFVRIVRMLVSLLFRGRRGVQAACCIDVSAIARSEPRCMCGYLVED